MALRGVEPSLRGFHRWLSNRTFWPQNDSITIHHRFSGDYRVKLSISHALSQSTKLCVFEERVLEIVQTTKDLPEALATSGTPSPLLSRTRKARAPSPALRGVGPGDRSDCKRTCRKRWCFPVKHLLPILPNILSLYSL